MVIELLPSTRDNLLRVALLEREDYGGKILSKFLGSSAWKMMGLSVRPVRQDFAGGVIKTSTHVSSLQLKAERLNFMGTGQNPRVLLVP